MGSATVIETVAALVSLLDDGFVYALHSGGVLAHPVRNRIVSILVDCGDISRDELAERLAADDALSPDDPERVEIALHHDHLPRLDDRLVVEYDRRTGDVCLWKDPETAAKMLESS